MIKSFLYVSLEIWAMTELWLLISWISILQKQHFSRNITLVYFIIIFKSMKVSCVMKTPFIEFIHGTERIAWNASNVWSNAQSQTTLTTSSTIYMQYRCMFDWVHVAFILYLEQSTSERYWNAASECLCGGDRERLLKLFIVVIYLPFYI